MGGHIAGTAGIRVGQPRTSVIIMLLKDLGLKSKLPLQMNSVGDAAGSIRRMLCQRLACVRQEEKDAPSTDNCNTTRGGHLRI